MRNNTLKAAIAASGRCAYAVAQDAGLSETALSKIIHGRRRVSKAEALRIANALGKKPCEIGLSGAIEDRESDLAQKAVLDVPPDSGPMPPRAA